MRIIAGRFKGAPLKSPKGLQTRPTTSRLREALFNILQNKIEGSRFLDLFSGSGLMGFEAMSRGAKSAELIDNHFQSIQCIKNNAAQLGLAGDLQVVKSDVILYLERCAKQAKQFDIIYADPPYKTTVVYQGKQYLLSQLVLHLIDTHNLLAPEGLLFIEEGDPLPSDAKNLKNLTLDRIKTCGCTALHQFSHGFISLTEIGADKLPLRQDRD